LKQEVRKVPPFFDAESLGKSLSQVNVDTIQTSSQTVKNHWYHGQIDADLFIWTDEKERIIKQQLICFGQVVEWNVLNGLRTGFIFETELSDSKNSVSIRFDSKPNQKAVLEAVQVVENVEPLEGSTRIVILEHFKNPHSLSTLSNDEVVKKYGKTGQKKSAWESLVGSLQNLFTK
jgi:hypothetical protein